MWISFSDHYKIGQNLGAISMYPRVVLTLSSIKRKHKHFPYCNCELLNTTACTKNAILTITITIICM